MMQTGSPKRIGRLSSWIFKTNFFTAGVLEKLTLHHYAEFRGDRSCRCRDIAIFDCFQLFKTFGYKYPFYFTLNSCIGAFYQDHPVRIISP